MIDDQKSIVFSLLGVVGGIVTMIRRYRDSEGEYNLKLIASDFFLLFVAGAPTAFFVGHEMLAQGYERAAFPLAYIAGTIANEVIKIAASRASLVLNFMTGGKL